MRYILSTLIFLCAATPLMAKTLTVYTYDSFVSEWGPGPKIKEAFEKTCECTIDFVGLADGVAILGRLKFEGKSSPADIVLGLDTGLVAEAKASGLVANHNVDTSALDVPGSWADEAFVPYDYGYFAFIYDNTKLKTPPASLEELVDGKSTIIIQDPRSSSPGLGLMLWMKKVYGIDASTAWAKLAPRIITVTSGWSEAYGLFLKGESDLVLSYSTSPAYHMVAEEVDKYQAAKFAEGHYSQIEVAAKLGNSKEPALADDFLKFLVSNEAQAILPTTQWMFPVNKNSGQLPEAFGKLIKVTNPLSFTSEEVMKSRADWVSEWREVLSR